MTIIYISFFFFLMSKVSVTCTKLIVKENFVLYCHLVRFIAALNQGVRQEATDIKLAYFSSFFSFWWYH